MSQSQGPAGPVMVEVGDEPLETIQPKADAKGFARPAFSKQMIYVHMGQRYPLATKLRCPDAGPYRPGFYLLAGPIFKTVGDYGNLALDDRQLQLVPIADALKVLTPLAGDRPKLAAAAA